jgi:hypothetical protein
LCEISNEYEIIFNTESDDSHFFGYYGISPVSKCGKYLLAHRANFEGRSITSSDFVEIGYYNIVNKQWFSIDISYAFNWQEGSMLQWLAGSKEVEFVYNVIENGRLFSKTFSIITGDYKINPCHVYACSPQSNHSAVISYTSISKNRASYGYVKSFSECINLNPLSISILNHDKGELVEILSRLTLEECLGRELSSKSYIQHFYWSPDGTKALFYLREKRGRSFDSCLIAISTKGEILNTYIENELSHITWRDDDSFIVFCRPITFRDNRFFELFFDYSKRLAIAIFGLTVSKKTKINSIRKIHRYGYYLYNIFGNSSPVSRFSAEDRDGHPSYIGIDKFISDTYQDSLNYRELYSYKLDDRSSSIIGRFYSPFNNCDYRCDLHPRYIQGFNWICIDSAHSGKRQIYLIAPIQR